MGVHARHVSQVGLAVVSVVLKLRARVRILSHVQTCCAASNYPVPLLVHAHRPIQTDTNLIAQRQGRQDADTSFPLAS